MRTWLAAAVLSVVSTDAIGYAPLPPRDYAPGFELTGVMPAAGRHHGGAAARAGSRIAAIDGGALVIDADSGQLVLANEAGSRIATLDIGAGAGLLVLDPASRRAFVADRAHDRIAVVDVHPRALELAATIATPAEPYGVALADGTLLVTAIADRALVAYDVDSHAERWREAVAAEPRAVAIAPDGKHAVVTHLTADGVELVDLTLTRARHTQLRVLRRDLAPNCRRAAGEAKSSLDCADPEGTSHARAAYAAVFLGDGLAAVAFERETPVPRSQFAATSRYGGSAIPITHHVGFVGTTGSQAVAQLSTAEPRALAYDGARDVLYVAGIGDGRLTRIEHASREDAAWSDNANLGDMCGADGLAVTAAGDVLAWCSFTRSIMRVRFEHAADSKAIPRYAVTTSEGGELARSRLDFAAHAGMVRFYTASRDISQHARAACATCHVDGRSDGLAWQIDGHALRTPVLAGRLADTAPYKWTGHDADLDASIMATIDRLGGRDGTHRDDYHFVAPDPIAAYLASLPSPRAPQQPADAIARGRALFASADLACESCHAGTALTDHQRHAFAGAPFELDTPSLRATAAAPRYLHDGSAATLDDVLQERGSIRGMIARPLTAAERADLAAYLRSL